MIGNVDVAAFNGLERIGWQFTSKDGTRGCIIGVTYDNKLYVDSMNGDGGWNGARQL